MKPITRDHYVRLLSRVTDYIYAHLDQPLDMDHLASVAGMSPYHWHRIYHAMAGETIAATVKRLRLHRAAVMLVTSALPVAQVAQRSGYDNLQSFTRIFHAAYGMPPAEYRKLGSHAGFLPEAAMAAGAKLDRVTLCRRAPITLAAVPHIGSYMTIGKAFDTLFRQLHGRLAPGARMIGVFYDDPSLVPEASLRSAAGVAGSDIPVNSAPLTGIELAGGPYALLRHQGPYADMAHSYHWLYGVWLPQSGREPADLPLFEEYLNSPQDTPPAELLTDIYLPLRPLPEEVERTGERT
jgi:AraC family transcriptional regulator